MGRYPTQTITIAPVLLEADQQNVLAMPRIWSSGDCLNVYSDRLGRVRKVPGHQSTNLTPYLTQEGLPARCVMLAPYKSQFGVSTFSTNAQENIRVVACFDDGTHGMELAWSDDLGQTWNFMHKLAVRGVRPDFAQFEQTLYLAVPGSVPLEVTDTTVSPAGGVRSPTPVATQVAAPEEGGLSGTYEWRVCSISDAGRRWLSGGSSNVLQIEKGWADIDWVRDTLNADVGGYEIYRTLGASEFFRLVDFVEEDGSPSYTYEDRTQDGDLLGARYLNEHGDPPPTGVHYVNIHNQRAIWGKTDEFPQRAWISDPAYPASVNAAFSKRDFDEDNDATDELTAIVGRFEGTWVAFLRRAIYRISGSGELIGGIPDWTVWRSNSSSGAVSAESIVQIPAGARFLGNDGEIQTTGRPTLAYFSRFNDIRLFDGEGDRKISFSIQDDLNRITDDAVGEVHAHHDVDRQVVQFYVPIDGSETPNYAIVWNYRDGTMAEMDGQEFSSSVVLPSSNENEFILVGSANLDGLTYESWTGDRRENQPYSGRWVSRAIYSELEEGGPGIRRPCRWMSLDLFMMADLGQTDMRATWWEGWAKITKEAFGQELVSVAGDEETHAVFTMQLLRNEDGAYLVSPAVRYAVEDDGSGDWGIEGAALVFKQLERRD